MPAVLALEAFSSLHNYANRVSGKEDAISWDSATDREGQQGQFAPGHQCKGPPKQHITHSNKI